MPLPDFGGEMPAASPDDRVLAQLAGAAFLQNADLVFVLPSGKTLGRDEFRAFSELNRASDNLLNLDRPPIVDIGEHLPSDYVLSFRNISPHEYQEKLEELRGVTEVMTPDELLDTTEAFAGSLDLGALKICIDTARQQRDAANWLRSNAEADDYSNVATVGEFRSALIESSDTK